MSHCRSTLIRPIVSLLIAAVVFSSTARAQEKTAPTTAPASDSIFDFGSDFAGKAPADAPPGVPATPSANPGATPPAPVQVPDQNATAGPPRAGPPRVFMMPQVVIICAVHPAADGGLAESLQTSLLQAIWRLNPAIKFNLMVLRDSQLTTLGPAPEPRSVERLERVAQIVSAADPAAKPSSLSETIAAALEQKPYRIYLLTDGSNLGEKDLDAAIAAAVEKNVRLSLTLATQTTTPAGMALMDRALKISRNAKSPLKIVDVDGAKPTMMVPGGASGPRVVVIGPPRPPATARPAQPVQPVEPVAPAPPAEPAVPDPYPGHGLHVEFFRGKLNPKSVKIDERTDRNLDFFFGDGVPTSRVPATNYSARWTGFIRAPRAGSYKFQLNSDDGSRMLIDDAVVVDQFDHAGTQNAVFDMTGRAQKFIVELWQGGGPSHIVLRWTPPQCKTPIIIPPEYFFTDYDLCGKSNLQRLTPPTGTGLNITLFGDEELKKPLGSDVDWHIDRTFGDGGLREGAPVDHFSIRWQGFLLAPKAGSYRLFAYADDHFRVRFKGRECLSNWNGGSNHQETTLQLSGGPEEIQVEFNDGRGPSRMSLHWEQIGGFKEQIIPWTAFFRDAKVAQAAADANRAGGVVAK